MYTKKSVDGTTNILQNNGPDALLRVLFQARRVLGGLTRVRHSPITLSISYRSSSITLSSLWARFIQAIYGMKGALYNSHNIPKRNSPWLDIIREEDCWLLDESLKQTYPRLFLLELNKNITVAAKMRNSTLISSFRRAPNEEADGAQSPRVPVPFPEDPYEAIRQACLVETDTESEPFEDPVETETHESSHTVASPTSLPDSTPPTHHTKESEDSDTSGARSTSSDFTAPLSLDHPLTHTSPTLVPFLCRTACMAVRVSPAMSPGLSTSITEVATMSDLAFRKRFRYSYETSPTSSPLDLPLRKRSRGTSELVEEVEEWDDEEEDEEVEEKDEGPAEGDVGLAARDKVLGMRVESLGLGGNEAVLEGQQRATPVVKTSMDPKDGRAYIDVPAYPPPVPPVQTPPSPEWSSGSLPISTTPSITLSPILSPMIPLTVPSPVASPATVKAEGFLTELGAQVEMQEGLIHDHTVRLGDLSPALFERYDRDI
ncbi:hypothetical protein Tco_0486583 [Tanacetum coccineum]